MDISIDRERGSGREREREREPVVAVAAVPAVAELAAVAAVVAVVVVIIKIIILIILIIITALKCEKTLGSHSNPLSTQGSVTLMAGNPWGTRGGNTRGEHKEGTQGGNTRRGTHGSVTLGANNPFVILFSTGKNPIIDLPSMFGELCQIQVARMLQLMHKL